MNDENVYRILTSRAPVVNGAEPSDIEWTDLQGRVGTLETDPKLLAALEDVDITGLADGDVLVWDAAAGVFRVGSVADPIEIDDGFAINRFGPVTLIEFVRGLTVAQHPSLPYIAIVEPLYGTSANTVAEGNHAHGLPTTTRAPITPQGYMSSGTRQLASTNVTLPAGKTCLVKAEIAPMQIRGADPGPCYYQLSLAINGNTRSTPSPGTGGYWVVQGVPKDATFGHERTIAGTGAAITVSASIAWGGAAGGFYTDAGDLVVTVTPDR